MSKQKIVLNKEAAKKKVAKRIEVSSTSQNQEDQNEFMAGGEMNEGARKEVPNVNEIGNQARSKYFPSQGAHQKEVPKIKLS